MAIKWLLSTIAVILTVCAAEGAMAQGNKDQLVRMADLEIDPGQLEAYKALLKLEIETSIRVEPGVLQLSAVALKDQPNRIRILEVYADQSAYEAHLRSPHFIEYKSATAKMVTSLNLLETTPVMLAAKAGNAGQAQ